MLTDMLLLVILLACLGNTYLLLKATQRPVADRKDSLTVNLPSAVTIHLLAPPTKPQPPSPPPAPRTPQRLPEVDKTPVHEARDAEEEMNLDDAEKARGGRRR